MKHRLLIDELELPYQLCDAGVGRAGRWWAAAARRRPRRRIGSIPGDTSLDRIGVYRIVDGRMHCRRTIRG